ncbi:MAG: helix-turn-helix domain-containing protein [Bryobacteraceae bacterium]|jgi:excisionase family DNA binding protein
MSTPDGPPDTGDRWFSVNEVAAHLGVAIDTVYRWIDGKGLPAHRVGRLWKCKLPEVDAWVRGDGPAETGSGGKKSQRRRSK